MELQITHSNNGVLPQINQQQTVNDSRFIEANTSPISLWEIRDKHVIPVFVKDNQPTISQVDFVGITKEVIQEALYEEASNLAIRVSHPIKGRTFEARNKKASELLDHEKTIYYERMAFSFDIPSITETIGGQELVLSCVGVKAYNHDNLYSFGGSFQRFKIGLGFKVNVCTNYCLSSNGSSVEVKVRNLDELREAVLELINNFQLANYLKSLNHLTEYELQERQFSLLLGRLRMYHHLPNKVKKELPQILIPDSFISTVTKNYYEDDNFSKQGNGVINMWKLYNLFTDAVKASYIDSYVDRNINSFELSKGICGVLDGSEKFGWFIK